MNSLSWTIYFANIVTSMIGWLVFMGVIGSIGIIISFIWWMIIGFNPKDADAVASIPFHRAFRRLAISLFVVGVGFSIILPDRQTIILIAGSQLGERLLKSQEVQGVVDPGLELLKTWVQKETARLKAPPKEQ